MLLAMRRAKSRRLGRSFCRRGVIPSPVVCHSASRAPSRKSNFLLRLPRLTERERERERGREAPSPSYRCARKKGKWGRRVARGFLRLSPFPSPFSDLEGRLLFAICCLTLPKSCVVVVPRHVSNISFFSAQCGEECRPTGRPSIPPSLSPALPPPSPGISCSRMKVEQNRLITRLNLERRTGRVLATD